MDELVNKPEKCYEAWSKLATGNDPMLIHDGSVYYAATAARLNLALPQIAVSLELSMILKIPHGAKCQFLNRPAPSFFRHSSVILTRGPY